MPRGRSSLSYVKTRIDRQREEEEEEEAAEEEEEEQQQEEEEEEVEEEEDSRECGVEGYRDVRKTGKRDGRKNTNRRLIGKLD